MAKAKTPTKPKKPNNSAAKDKSKDAKTGGLTDLVKTLAKKVVDAVEAPAPAKGKNNASGKKSTPSIMTSSAPTAETAPAPSAVLAANAAVEVPVEDEEVILTDAEGRRYCRATDCDQIGLVDGYCRYHYLYFWKKIQVRKKILADGKLERYIDELTSRYTDKFIELLRKDTRTEKDFLAAVQELELDGSDTQSANDDDESKTYIEEISGVGGAETARDDEGY